MSSRTPLQLRLPVCLKSGAPYAPPYKRIGRPGPPYSYVCLKSRAPHVIPYKRTSRGKGLAQEERDEERETRRESASVRVYVRASGHKGAALTPLPNGYACRGTSDPKECSRDSSEDFGEVFLP